MMLASVDVVLCDFLVSHVASRSCGRSHSLTDDARKLCTLSPSIPSLPNNRRRRSPHSVSSSISFDPQSILSNVLNAVCLLHGNSPAITILSGIGLMHR